MKRLIKKLFINPVIKAELKKQEQKRKNTVSTIYSGMKLQDKANLFCTEKEIKYCIDVLNGML